MLVRRNACIYMNFSMIYKGKRHTHESDVLYVLPVARTKRREKGGETRMVPLEVIRTPAAVNIYFPFDAMHVTTSGGDAPVRLESGLGRWYVALLNGEKASIRCLSGFRIDVHESTRTGRPSRVRDMTIAA